MPNWCTTTVSVNGPVETVRELVNAVAYDGTCHEPSHKPADAFCLYRIVPVPADATIDVVAALWGTKWCVPDTDLDDTADLPTTQSWTGAVSWTLETAWTPPLLALDALAVQFPTVKVEAVWDEPGNDVAGTVEWANGHRTREESYPSPMNAQIQADNESEST